MPVWNRSWKQGALVGAWFAANSVGAVASLVGTVVGAFFGVQVGAVGKERAEAARERSDQGIKAALSMLPPEAAEQLRAQMNR